MNNGKRTLALIFGYGAIGIIALIVVSLIFGIGGNVMYTRAGTNSVDEIQQSVDDFENIDISKFSGTINFVEGNKFEVAARNVSDEFESTSENGTLKIQGGSVGDFMLNRFGRNRNPQITITMPRGTDAGKVVIDLGAGDLNIDTLNAEEFILKAGASDVNISELFAEKCEIEGGVGEVQIYGGEIRDCTVRSGVGEVEVNALLLGNCKLSNGVGEIRASIPASILDYYIVINKGLGDIEIDGDTVSNGNYGTKGADNTITVDTGVGEVDLEFVN